MFNLIKVPFIQFKLELLLQHVSLKTRVYGLVYLAAAATAALPFFLPDPHCGF